MQYARENEKGRKEGYDCILSFDYACESMELFVNGRKVNDYFYTGQKHSLVWDILLPDKNHSSTSSVA